MKKIKKLASLLLALVMVLSMTVTGFAANETGTITINDAIVGQKYTVYEILKLESYDTASKAYAYKASSDSWSAFINSTEIKDIYVGVDDQGYVTWIEGASAADFAKKAQKYAADNKISNQGSEVAGSTTVEFIGLELGYYLVDSTLGALCSLDTTNPDVVMEEKNAAPENVKTVQEDSTDNYGEKNDADIGQTVNFKSTITAQAGAENYVFHDEMSEGLTYTGVTAITLNGKEVNASDNDTVNYTVSAPATDGDTFDVTFTQAFCDTLKANDKIVISYTATLNEKAVIAGEGNPNTSKLGYGDKNNTKYTPDSTTTTYTWDVDIFKYTKDGETEKALAGATFTLSKNVDGTTPIALISKGDNVYRVAKTDETGTVTEITTDATGKFTIEGLDSDTYYLTETAAPSGYNKLAAPTTIVIGENGATSVDNITVNEVKVLNNTGSMLPSTGGIGTTIFYAAGIILMAGAVFFVVRRRRAN